MHITTPSLLAGYFYPTDQRVKCPSHHPCTVTKKCQNYSPHNLQCVLCESRVSPPKDLGGLLPEGAFVPDLQDAVAIIQDQMNRAIAHPDQEPRDQMSQMEMTDKLDRHRKATDLLSEFPVDNSLGDISMQLKEESVKMLVDKERASKFLGQKL